ncbi:MAG: ImmA/IrrE family metallo-endopeptidase [Magnetococcales bacterium]|nr:ImmA/IrrE family metallo-endopeptidase [Magnetococcales bacterium]
MVHILGDAIWSEDGHDGVTGIDEHWDGLLDHLAKNWHALGMEQTYPPGHNPLSPDQFLDEALASLDWSSEPTEILYPREREIMAFADRHNLASGMREIHLDPIYLLREGNTMRVVADDHDLSMPIWNAVQTLENLGNNIARSVSSHSPRGAIILENWHNRSQPLPTDRWLALVTGMSSERINRMTVHDNVTSEYLHLPSMSEPGPVQIAARMTHHVLLDQDLKEVLKLVATLNMTPLGGQLLQLRQQAENHLARLAGEKAYVQGYELARLLREKLELPDHEPVDPETLLKQWNVSIEKTRMVEDVDAIARWEDDHAVILVNQNGKHAQYPWGRRTTLAHEMAHLLVDTLSTLPAIEVLGGRVPARLEKRANAFAAEFLLPVSHVETLVANDSNPEILKKWLDSLTQQFMVSRTLAARQIENFLAKQEKLSQECRQFLDREANRYQQGNNWLTA